MRAYPRPRRVIQRLGNALPDVSGEINWRRTGFTRARTDRGLGVVRLGMWTVSAELVPTLLDHVD